MLLSERHLLETIVTGWAKGGGIPRPERIRSVSVESFIVDASSSAIRTIIGEVTTLNGCRAHKNPRSTELSQIAEGSCLPCTSRRSDEALFLNSTRESGVRRENNVVLRIFNIALIHQNPIDTNL